MKYYEALKALEQKGKFLFIKGHKPKKLEFKPSVSKCSWTHHGKYISLRIDGINLGFIESLEIRKCENSSLTVFFFFSFKV
jgi:hypothetical protein